MVNNNTILCSSIGGGCIPLSITNNPCFEDYEDCGAINRGNPCGGEFFAYCAHCETPTITETLTIHTATPYTRTPLEPEFTPTATASSVPLTPTIDCSNIIINDDGPPPPPTSTQSIHSLDCQVLGYTIGGIHKGTVHGIETCLYLESVATLTGTETVDVVSANQFYGSCDDCNLNGPYYMA
jgi:hypothetical protein